MSDQETLSVISPDTEWEGRGFAIEVVVPTQDPIEALRVGQRVSAYLKDHVFDFRGPVDMLIGSQEGGQVVHVDGVVAKRRQIDERPDSQLSSEELQIRDLVSEHLTSLQSPEQRIS